MAITTLSSANALFMYAIIALPVSLSWAQFSPCDGKAMLNQNCDGDSDCEMKGSVCLRQKCKCHANYAEMVDKNGAHRCMRLPSRIGQECQNKCREPLFCRSGRCQCVQRGSTSILNGECVQVSKAGDRCTRHGDCTAPFSACVNQQCTCISGTMQHGSKCVASKNCPMGTPSGTCIRRALPHQIPNFVDSADTCPSGHFCVSTIESPLGHCCPAVCPLGSSIDTSYTCIPGMGMSSNGGATSETTKPSPITSAVAAANLVFAARDTTSSSGLQNLTRFLNNLGKSTVPCPSDTHFCHYVSSDTFSQAVCCKRPCNAMSPFSLHLNGECVARGQLKSECRYHEQCGAGEGMSCSNGTCQCIAGFVPGISDQITHQVKNPSQYCVRECEKGKSLSRDTSCLSKSELMGPCFVQEQCPDNSGCWRGRCLCRCGFYRAKQGRCVPIPATTTPKPPPQPIPNLNQQVGILNQLWGLLGPQTG